MKILEYSFLGNSLKQYLISVAIFAGAIIGAFIFKYVVNRFIEGLTKRTKTKLDDVLVKVFDSILVYVLTVGGSYFALSFLVIPDDIWVFITKIVQVLIILKLFGGASIITNFVIEHYLSKYLTGKNGFGIHFIRLLTRISKFAIWIIGISIVLNIFGYNITALVTGLGIGGLAIALAAQDTLGNFFSSVSIIADKPFRSGDVIKFNGTEGIIEDVGMRSTKIQTFQGTFISVPNSVIAQATIENVSKRKSRRYDGTLGLVYHTPVSKIKEAIEILKKIFKEEKMLTNEYRVNFTEFEDSSLLIEFTYYVKEPQDYNKYLKTKNKINLAIKDKLEKAGIEFAFPTQTLHVVNQEAKQA